MEIAKNLKGFDEVWQRVSGEKKAEAAKAKPQNIATQAKGASQQNGVKQQNSAPAKATPSAPPTQGKKQGSRSPVAQGCPRQRGRGPYNGRG